VLVTNRGSTQFRSLSFELARANYKYETVLKLKWKFEVLNIYRYYISSLLELCTYISIIPSPASYFANIKIIECKHFATSAVTLIVKKYTLFLLLETLFMIEYILELYTYIFITPTSFARTRTHTYTHTHRQRKEQNVIIQLF
jgi:hypothetical protein